MRCLPVRCVCFLSLILYGEAFIEHGPGWGRMRMRGFPSAHLTFAVQDDHSYGEDDNSSSASSRGRRRPIRRAPSANSNQKMEELRQQQQDAIARHQEALKDPQLLTEVRFSDRQDISQASKRAITEVLGLQQMTEIQLNTFAAVIDGQSVLGRARTGTGKTLAFLLPAIERLLAADIDVFRPGKNIGMIVVAPTRELAMQIAEQGEALLTFHAQMNVACVYGGTKIQRDMRLLSSAQLPAILVCTPGRLLEHLDNTRIGKRKFSDIAAETQIVVLDEADRLLEAFQKETKQILSHLPRAEKRQNLLFSATLPKRLRGLMKSGMGIEFNEIDCIGDSKALGEANRRVEQFYLQLERTEDYLPTLIRLIEDARFQDPENHKIIVFFPASRLVRFFYHFFTTGLGIEVLELHSRMSQASRSRTRDEFKAKKASILFTSDVSARGVDYPNVSLVIQYGAPSNGESYIHRLGRTARAGSSGRGILVYLPFEKQIRMRGSATGDIKQLRFEEASGHASDSDFMTELDQARLKVRSGHSVLTPGAESAATAFLAYYAANPGLLNATEIYGETEMFALSLGLLAIPVVEASILKKLGITEQ